MAKKEGRSSTGKERRKVQSSKFKVPSSKFADFLPGDAVYRFFELFDLANVENAKTIFQLAQEKQIRLTPPPKPVFEEKMLFALLWNRNLRGFWRQELGEAFFQRLLKLVPCTWLVDPTPLPPRRCTINFFYPDVKSANRSWWLVIDGSTVDLCSTNPGFEVDLYVRAALRSMTAVWMGLSTVQKEIDAGQIELVGDKDLAQSMQRWLGLSPFAKEKSRVSA